MKKFLAIAAAIVMAAGVMSGCSSSTTEETPVEGEETTEEGAEGEETAERTQFIVGFDAEYPPYGYMDENGEYVGFDLDLAQEVCDRNGWELVKQPIDWNSKDMELNSGSIDCIWNGFTMTGREDEYTFSDPYVDNSIVFVVLTDSDIQTKDDLAGKVVVTQAGSSALTALTNEEDNDENLALAASFASLEQVADYNTAFMELESGLVDAIAVDIGVAQYQLTSRGDTFRQLEEPLSTEQYAIGFKLGNTELRDQVQATLNEMVEDGTFDEIVANYSDYNLDQMVCLGK
ncbi:MAG TPA: amino acid ABC transporter substrate-binding protein [Firmicutes bacterium]|nr:amino acid ABC transporter substrate-binding protein [Bacillota bacterium]